MMQRAEATAAFGAAPPTWEPRFASLHLQTSRHLGRGAFGEVYLVKASPVADGAAETLPVAAAAFALKRSSLVQISEVGVERAKGEARLLQRLGEEHESILRCFDFRVVDGPVPALELLLEFAPLGDLSSWLKHHRDRQLSKIGCGQGTVAEAMGLPEAEVVSFACDVAAGLAHIHALRPKVLHRDIKPANVVLFPLTGLVDGTPRVKIADFGIAKILESDNSFARAATVIGTPHYFSPEICRGEKYDERSDAWALGCVIYEMVCLKRPFHQAEGNIAVLALRVMEGKYDKETLMQRAAHYNGQLMLLLVSLLQLDPKDRARASDLVPPLRLLRDGSGFSLLLASVSWWESLSALQLDAADESVTLLPTLPEAAGADEATRGAATEDSWIGARQFLLGSRPTSPWLPPTGSGRAGPPWASGGPATALPTSNPLQEALLSATALPSEKWVRAVDLLAGSNLTEKPATIEDPPTLMPEPSGWGTTLGTEAVFGLDALAGGAAEAGGIGGSFGGTLRFGEPLLEPLHEEATLGEPLPASPYATSLQETARYEFGASQTEWLREDVSSAFIKSECAVPSRLAWMGYSQEDALLAQVAAAAGACESTEPVHTFLGSFGRDAAMTATAFSFCPEARDEERPVQEEQEKATGNDGLPRFGRGAAGPRIFLRPLWRGSESCPTATDTGPVIFCFAGAPESARDPDTRVQRRAPPPPPTWSQPAAPAEGTWESCAGERPTTPPPLVQAAADPADGWYEVEPAPTAPPEPAPGGTLRRGGTCGIFALTAVD